MLCYVVTYVCKAEGELSALMKHAVAQLPDHCKAKDAMNTAAHTFIHGRELSVVEAVYRACPTLKLRQLSVGVVYIPVAFPELRTRLVKPARLLPEDADDEDVFFSNLPEKYSGRPNSLNSMCLAEFASLYRVKNKLLTDDIVASNLEYYDEDADGEEELLHREKAENKEFPQSIKVNNTTAMVCRKTPAVITYIRFNRLKQPAEYWYSKLLLFMPWRNEEQSFDKIRIDHLEAVKLMEDKEFLKNWKRFESDQLETIEEAIAAFDENPDALKEFWTHMAPEGVAGYYEELQPNAYPEEDAEMDEADRQNVQIVDEQTRTVVDIIAPELLPTEERRKMVAALNERQAEVHQKINDWCKEKVERKLNGQDPPDPLYLFISGPGGTGKSHLTWTCRQTIQWWFTENSGDPNKTPQTVVSVIGAFTGTAALNIGGNTLHSLFGLSINHKNKFDNKKMSSERLEHYRQIFRHVEIIIIDEISMLGIDHFYQIYEHLQLFKQNKLPFGGVSVIAVGDLYQLPPVMQKKIYDNPSFGLTNMVNHIWRSNFDLYELTEIMRQKGDQKFAELLNRVRNS